MENVGKIEYGTEASIDIDSDTVMGIDLSKDDCDMTCIVVIRKVGSKIEVIDTLQQHGNSMSETLRELMDRYPLKIEEDQDGWNVFRT